jgi:hypothetical protein
MSTPITTGINPARRVNSATITKFFRDSPKKRVKYRNTTNAINIEINNRLYKIDYKIQSFFLLLFCIDLTHPTTRISTTIKTSELKFNRYIHSFSLL